MQQRRVQRCVQCKAEDAGGLAPAKDDNVAMGTPLRSNCCIIFGDCSSMAPSPLPAAIWTDVLWCLGLGLCLAAARDVAALVFGSGPVRTFVGDVLAFGAAAVLLCGFAASVSASGVPRWYMAAGMGLGALSWGWALSGAVHRAAAAVLAALTWPLRILSHRVAQPLRVTWRQKRTAYKKRKTIKNSKKVLQKPKRVLYN